jgi:hypothetical protein
MAKYSMERFKSNFPIIGLLLCLIFILWRLATQSDVTIRDLEPNDIDYPKINPNPKEVVNFTAVIPDALQVRFDLWFFVDWTQLVSDFSAQDKSK